VRHLVTGGSGFLGNLVVRRLLAQGETVRVLDLWSEHGENDGADFVRCDVRDRDGVTRAMHDIDVVHHNAALVPVTKSGDAFRTVNVEGTRVVAEEARKACVRAFVHMSSSAIFGVPHANPILDTTLPDPIERYGASKLAGEEVARNVFEATDIPLIVIRPRTILGRGRLGIMGILFEWIAEGRNVYTIGDGNVRFQFVHADDLIDAYMLLLNHNRAGTYNVGTDRFGTMREALQGVIRYAGSPSKVVPLPKNLVIGALRLADWLQISPLGPYHYHAYGSEYFFDVSALLAVGWKPRFSNDEMFRDAFDWFRENQAQRPNVDQASPHQKTIHEKILGLVRKLS
jgi:nucleoside-diphosphate-sugar epimerase